MPVAEHGHLGAGRRRTRLAAATAALTLLLGAQSVTAASARTHGAEPGAETFAGELPPLATDMLTWTSQRIAPGVELRSGVLNDAASAPAWTVTVQAPAVNRLTQAATWAPLGDRAWADGAAKTLRDAGLDPRVEEVAWDTYTDTPAGTMGWQVRVGKYATQAAANTAAATVRAAGLRTAVEWTGYDGRQAADAERVRVVTVDPARFHGSAGVSDGGNVADRETTSAVARRLGSLVGVNGGFFVTSDADGVQGTMSGLSVVNGELESMAVGSRAALVVEDEGRRFRVENLSSTATVSAGGASYAVQGINRTPGKVRDCGRPGTVPTEEPRQDVTCTLADDLVKFTSAYRAPLPEGDGTQVVLDKAGRVVSVGGRGGTVPERGAVLQGIGGAGEWLAAHAVVGRPMRVRETVRDAAGHPLRLGPGDSVVSAAPTLVQHGAVHIDAATEGTLDPLDLSFGFAWSNVRQPRTLAGVDARGRLLLVTVDGRGPGVSEGFTLGEAARFLRGLGAVDGLNLDGGGSTTMVVDGTLVNTPSDATGERAVGDTLQILPR